MLCFHLNFEQAYMWLPSASVFTIDFDQVLLVRQPNTAYLKMPSVNAKKCVQLPADFFTFIKEILEGNLHILSSN